MNPRHHSSSDPAGATGLYRVGGLSLIASGLLFFAVYSFQLVAGEPPSSGERIIAWAHSNEFSLMMTNELLFFAAVFLVPGVIGLHHSLVAGDRVKAAVGAGTIGVVIPLLAMLLVVHGRLVYPMYGIELHDPAVAELLIGLFYGGWHAALLLLGGATIVLSLAMRRSPYGAAIAYLGFVTGVFDIIGSYPDRIGPVLLFASQFFLAAWFATAGWRLWRHATTWP